MCSLPVTLGISATLPGRDHARPLSISHTISDSENLRVEDSKHWEPCHLVQVKIPSLKVGKGLPPSIHPQALGIPEHFNRVCQAIRSIYLLPGTEGH